MSFKRESGRKAMALAVGTRAGIGRASTFTAMAAISSSSSSAAFLSSGVPPLYSCTSDKSLAIPSRWQALRCHRVLVSSSKAAVAIPSRSIGAHIVASLSSSATSIDSSDQSPLLTSSSSTPPSPPADAGAEAVEVDALDIRVGRVLKAWKHPEADSLYVEEVDLAEPEGPRTICSGLVKYLSLEELEGRAVLVLANLKARNMRGVKSNGMLLAASNAEHTVVQLLSPPEGTAPGERVWFGEEIDQATQSAAGSPNQVQKKKIWETVQPLLKTREDCVAMFQLKPMRTSSGLNPIVFLRDPNPFREAKAF